MNCERKNKGLREKIKGTRTEEEKRRKEKGADSAKGKMHEGENKVCIRRKKGLRE